MDGDTLYQLSQAQKNVYDSWHPPLMAYWWHWLLKILPNSWGVFLYDEMALWFGLFLVARFLLPKHSLLAAGFILFIGFLPPIFSINSLVWKDAVFGSTLLLLFGLMMPVQQNRYSPIRICGIILVAFFAMSLRHNGLFAVLPFLIWIGGLSSSHQFRLKQGLLVGFLLASCMLFDQKLMEKWLVDYAPQFPEQAVYTFDLAGVSVGVNKNLFPDVYDVSVIDLRVLYRPYSVFNLFWPTAGMGNWKRPNFVNAQYASTISQSWRTAIFEHPRAYLKHRLRFALMFLGFNVGPERGKILFPPTNLPLDSSPLRIDSWSVNYLLGIKSIEHGFLFRAYFYFFPLCLMTFFLFLRPHPEWARAMAVSGLFFTFSFFIAGVAADFRYSFWLALTTLILSSYFLIENANWLRDQIGRFWQGNKGASHRVT